MNNLEHQEQLLDQLEAIQEGDFEKYLHDDNWHHCDRCRNCETRIGDPVFGKGPTVGAEVMFIGESPGIEEERTGRTFVGAAGTLLHDVLYMLGVNDHETRFRFTNIVMCRPADFENPRRSRKPTSDEIQACQPRLQEEILTTDPMLIVSLGSIALQALGGKSCTLGKYLGEITEIKIPGKLRKEVVYPLLATWHPAKVLYEMNPDEGLPIIEKLTDLFVYDSHYHNLARDVLCADALAHTLRLRRQGHALSEDVKEALRAFRFTNMPVKWTPKVENQS